MIYIVYERKTIIMLALGLIILFGGCWFYLNNFLSAEEVRAPVNVEAELKPQGQPKNSSETVKKQEFFVDCRLTRDRIRSQQIDVLKEIAGNPVSSADTRDNAQQELMKITERTAMEVELEKLVVAQGFRDAVVLIQNESATVIIQGTSFTNSDAEKIRDVVSRVALLNPDSIFVIPKP
ncbi:MAG: SpoIIIAH-like family protein [Syntrophaceticus sp.]